LAVSATGLLVKSNLGRPTKIEGNPQHPASLGATDATMQASVLTVYDPDRSRSVTRNGDINTWANFVVALSGAQEVAGLKKGAGFASYREPSPRRRWERRYRSS